MKNTCYLSFDTTSYQPNDKRVRSAKLIVHVIALRRLLHVQAVSPTLFPAFLVFSEPHPSILSLPTSVKLLFS